MGATLLPDSTDLCRVYVVKYDSNRLLLTAGQAYLFASQCEGQLKPGYSPNRMHSALYLKAAETKSK